LFIYLDVQYRTRYQKDQHKVSEELVITYSRTAVSATKKPAPIKEQVFGS